jgi:hypothetical protein
MPPRDHRSSTDDTAPGACVFLCYRRADTSAVAARVAERLIRELGESRVFLDVRAMVAGRNFRLQLRDAVTRSAVMLVLIGPNWLTDARGGRRLDDPQDHVRNEIEEGLLRGLLVIPVLVDGASMPPSSELPPALMPLAELQALQIAHSTYRHDDDVVVSRVVEHLRPLVPNRRTRPTGALAAMAVLAALVVLVGASLVALRPWTDDPLPATSVPSYPSAAPAVTDAASAPNPVPAAPTHEATPPQSGGSGASIQAAYDQPDECSTVATVTGDLHGDPRVAGRVLWVVAVLDASPNVLYYPKMQVSAADGRFSVPIDLNTTSGGRRGRFGLVVSPTDRARDDLQRSLDADIAKNDSAYPDERRTRLQIGNIEIATTPFVNQRC